MTAIADLQPEYILGSDGKTKAVILSLECITALLQRLNQYEQDDDWDKQIQADAESGRLDRLFAADIQAYEAGQYQPI
ncbi:hypothetical protein [Thiothrix subterranea]|uniref:Uncharacterized protein n=1 Tax=Thiothrix subterranea TaxID=2735563 RepID=A0AA51MRU6_9GAMM|nr:hypothetical protein [Thiothrix subterranea]MDQ5770146.1 hypothetical protein [Thiothrix subterranea]WML88888.1 hypothetical protein RCG00_11020 [Thiothrix subterranea]